MTTLVVSQQSEVANLLVEEAPFKSKPVDRPLFDDSDSSDGELFKTKLPDTVFPTEGPVKKGGLKSNAKINSSLLGSESDDSIFSSQAAIPTPKKTAAPSFLLADSDDDGKNNLFSFQIHFIINFLFLFIDDLFASTPKHRDRPKPEPTLRADNRANPPASDPLLHYQ